jgi:hypothetical protein
MLTFSRTGWHLKPDPTTHLNGVAQHRSFLKSPHFRQQLGNHLRKRWNHAISQPIDKSTIGSHVSSHRHFHAVVLSCSLLALGTACMRQYFSEVVQQCSFMSPEFSLKALVAIPDANLMASFVHHYITLHLFNGQECARNHAS